MLERFGAFLKRLWANKVAKTIIVTALGAAAGILEPVLVAGEPMTLELLHRAFIGAITAVMALYIRKPEPVPAPAPVEAAKVELKKK